MTQQRLLHLAVAACLVLPVTPMSGGSGPSADFAVPPGFEVSLYADDSLATDIFSLTIDSRGRVVVAGKGYVKVLHDTDGDGRADKATLFSDRPKSGAHGMCFDGNDLICNGDNGVRRYSDTDGDGRCDHVSDIWLPTKNDGEHAANGIVRGPDGWYYMICGNDAGITRAHVRTKRSPIQTPVAGTVVRFAPDGTTSEIFADGFRNPYDLAFNHLGHLFTVDSDGERVHHLPYYTPNRLYDIAQGMNHGWILPGWQRGWARPACWPDNVERLVEIGRGSPTGVVVYRHRAFPERYRGGVFSLCWTFGRVYFAPLEQHGATYQSKLEVFMRTTGDVGFAPTDMAVGPDGDLFIAIGGRGTRGSVFRVRYRGSVAPLPQGPVRAVLAADEPLSSWSRARWLPEAQRLGALAFAGAVVDERLPLPERLRAVEILTELYGGVPHQTAQEVKGPPDLVARIAWSLAHGKPTDESFALLASLTAEAHPRIARAAWEAIAAWPAPLSTPQARMLYVAGGLGHAERRVRAAFLHAARGSPDLSNRLALTQAFKGASTREQLAYFWVDAQASASVPQRKIEAWLAAVAPDADPSLRMEGVRLMQLALGDVVVAEGADKTLLGYAAQDVDRLDAALRRKLAQQLTPLFPSGDSDLDRELARLLGMLAVDVPDLPSRLATRWTPTSAPADDIHYLLVLSRLQKAQLSLDLTRKTAAALNGIYVKLAAVGARPSDQVPAVLEGLCARLLERDPTLAAAIVVDPTFGVPGHELYADRLPLAQKQAAARTLVARTHRLSEEQARAAWSPELVRVVSSLPDEEALPILRAQFADPRLTDAIALILAAKRLPADQPRFVDALGSSQARVVGAAAEALRALGTKSASVTELAAAVKALRRVTLPPGDGAARKVLGDLLTIWSGAALPADAAAAAWSDWFTKTYPAAAPTLLGMSGASNAAWQARLAKVAWDSGDVGRGAVVYQRKSCFRCHADSRRLGPDLTGVAQRLARDDLFTALIDPSKDIAPAYVPTTITTPAGKVYSGMLIYESPELILLQTTPDTTVRLVGSEVQLQPGRTSFMPANLLDDASDQDLADLYAYLKTLRKR